MFLTTLQITNNANPTWRDQFNSSLRGLVLNNMNEPMRKNYVAELKSRVNINLFYRVKWFENSVYNLINIWDSEEGYNNFYKAVFGELFFEEYKKLGYSVVFLSRNVTFDEILTLIDITNSKPGRVIQALSPNFNKNICIGDPL